MYVRQTSVKIVAVYATCNRQRVPNCRHHTDTDDTRWQCSNAVAWLLLLLLLLQLLLVILLLLCSTRLAQNQAAKIAYVVVISDTPATVLLLAALYCMYSSTLHTALCQLLSTSSHCVSVFSSCTVSAQQSLAVAAATVAGLAA
jgi:hypothetical protein